MIDWKALSLLTIRTIAFMLGYFVGMMILVALQKRKHTDELHPWVVPFSIMTIVFWALVIAGVVRW